jgi:AraC family transcriptional regulator
MDPVRKALWYVESFLACERSLDDLARAAGVSRFHLTRAFGNATGKSVMRYVRARRLSEAARRLAGGERDILALALDCGYGSHEAFSRAFRDQFNVAPEVVRRRASVDDLDLQETIRMADTVAITLAEPTLIHQAERLFAGLARRYHYATMTAIPAQWNAFNSEPFPFARRHGDAAFGIVHNSDDDGNFDYLTGFEVDSFTALEERWSRLRLPAQRYAVFATDSHIAAIRQVMDAIWSGWLPGSGEHAADAPLIERYPASFDPATGAGGFEIWVPIAG